MYGLARNLLTTGDSMTGYELANYLNSNGFTTDYGTAYQGLRGTYTLLRGTYYSVKLKFGKAEADLIAISFKKPNGQFAWE